MYTSKVSEIKMKKDQPETIVAQEWIVRFDGTIKNLVKQITPNEPPDKYYSDKNRF